MTLDKYKLGALIEQTELRNSNGKYSVGDVRGISIEKKLIPTKADMRGVNLAPYKIVRPNEFAYVPVTSRNGDKITIAHNFSGQAYIVSSSYVTFKVKASDKLLPEYFFMYLNRAEFDRFTRFSSWGSARETLSWEDLCDIDITLPSVQIQQKYVDVYSAVRSNIESGSQELKVLKSASEAILSNMKSSINRSRIGKFLREVDIRNTSGTLGVPEVKGIATSKEFIQTKADLTNVDLKNYKVVSPGQFAYVPDTSRRGDKISLALNTSNTEFLVSSISTVFETDTEHLDPMYLMLYLRRPDFDRYARYNSWGSARESFDWVEMNDVSIPLPPIAIQRMIARVLNSAVKQMELVSKAQKTLTNICPILIRCSLADGGGKRMS